MLALLPYYHVVPIRDWGKVRKDFFCCGASNRSPITEHFFSYPAALWARRRRRPNATFAVEDSKGEVASFTTDDQRRFRASLPPGHYKVSLKGRKSSIGRFGPFEVDVASGRMTKVQWECDTGIR
jgi:hypothetical protein